MPGDAKMIRENIDEKLKYIGLNLENVQDTLKQQVNLNYKVVKEFDNSSYKIYKYISVKDIEIFITPKQRLASLKEKYKTAEHLSKYLDKSQDKYIELIEALSNTSIEEIQKIEEEQKLLNEKMPWNIKYKNAFKWQIYYSKNDNKYFMLVPLSEKDNATLFYLLKEKINCLNNNIDKKIYVPICDEEYSYKYLSKGQVSDIENYLWFFTKKWPSIYEVYDKQNNKYIQIIGKTNVYQGVESSYKIIIENNKEAEEKYKLMKALFIIASDLKFIYNFECEVDDNGILKFLFQEDELEFKYLEKFLKEQVDKKLDETKDIIEDTKELEEKLIDLKQENEKRNEEYTNKEKQIVMFLQCKKTFIGRFKYFFKTKKSKKKITLKGIENLPKIIDFIEDEEENGDFVFEEKDRYTIEDLLTICHILEKKETIYKDKKYTIKALEEKINILNKKIENADLYIQEIEKHKRSIFEFWKFTNKDLPDAIAEAEKLKQEEKNKIKKSFNYQEDMQNLGKKMDEFQKNTLSKNEIDALYVVKDYIDIINILCKTEIDDEDNSVISQVLASEKSKYDKQLSEKDVIYFDIFGNIDKEPEKIKEPETIEERKDKYQILHLDSKMKLNEFKETLNKFKRILEKEYNKIKLPYDISLYCLLNQNTMSEWSVANINPDNIIQKDTKRENIDIIKYNIPEGSSVLFYTNCILYKGNNTNIGINDDSETLLHLNRFDRELKGKLKRKVCLAKNEYENIVKSIKIYEYDLNPKDIEEANNDK